MNKQRILVVEDDSIFRNYLYQVLKYEYEVVAVVNPLEALAELARGKFALMLTDLRMPEMDGRELVEKVHAELDPNLMVIVITAFEGDWPVDTALANHVFRYLRKGAFLPSELKQNVAKAIEMQRSIVSLEEYRKREDCDIYRDAFNNAAGALFITDPDGRFLTVNQSFRNLTGYGLDELHAIDLKALLGDRVVLAQTAAADFKPIAARLAVKSGQSLPVEVWLRPLANLKDLPEALGGSLRLLTDDLDQAQAGENALMAELSAELENNRTGFERLNAHCRNLVIWLDRSLCCQFASSMIERQLGYPVKGLVGRRLDWSRAISPEDVGQVEAVRMAVAGKAAGHSGTVRVVGANRHHFHFSFEVFCRYDETGAFTGLEIVAEDVTARVAAEQELRRANQRLLEINERLNGNVDRKLRELQEFQERYRHIVEESMDVVLAFDDGGRVTYVNQRGLSALGLRLDEVCGRSYQDFLKSSPAQLAEMKHVLESEAGPGALNLVVATVQGQRTWRVSIDIVTVAGRREFICLARDITLKIVRDERLSLLANIEHYNADAIIALDNERRVISWNQGAAMMFGWSEEEVIGQPAFFLVPEEFRGQDEAILAEVSRHGFVRDCETKRLTRDGRILDVNLTHTALKDAQGNLTGFSSIIKDITDNKKMEQALIQSERLAATGRLAASVAHEINNPLYGIRSCLKHILSSADGAIDRQFVELALKETDRIADLVRNMKSFYQPSSAHVEAVDLGQLLKELLTFNRKYLEENRVKLEFAREGEFVCECVPDQLRQVFLNLLTNAVEAMPEGGAVAVAIERAGADQVVVTVRDSGVGISETDLAHIFDMFYTKKPKVKGVGLGLSVSYGIIRRHGGSIAVTSQPGKGSCFTVTLPVHAVASQQPLAEAN